MDDKRQKRVLQELARRKAAEAALEDTSDTFGAQTAFVNDASDFVAADCSRRAGKTHGIGRRLAKACYKYPGEMAAYVTLTRQTAKDILWPQLRQINALYGLGMEFKANTGDVTFPNGSKIVLRGLSSRSEGDKFRGPRYSAIVVDEAQAFPMWLEEVIHEDMGPACADFGASVALTGTPNAACRGFFHDVVHGHHPEWSVHQWTLVDNPHLVANNPKFTTSEEWLENYKKIRGLTGLEPGFQREYLGKWVRSLDGLVFKLKPNLNYVSEFNPEDGDWEYVLALDLGYNDPTAFVTLAFERNQGRVCVAESYKEAELTESRVVAKVERLMDKYDYVSIVADSGGYGKAIVEGMRQDYGIPVEPADKKKRLAAIERVNNALLNGSLTINTSECGSLIEEMEILQWDERKQENGVFEFDKRFADHESDALRYGYMECQALLVGGALNDPEPGTPEYWSKFEENLWDAEERAMKDRDSSNWFDVDVSREIF